MICVWFLNIKFWIFISYNQIFWLLLSSLFIEILDFTKVLIRVSRMLSPTVY